MYSIYLVESSRRGESVTKYCDMHGCFPLALWFGAFTHDFRYPLLTWLKS